jgi:hypothetical protein
MSNFEEYKTNRAKKIEQLVEWYFNMMDVEDLEQFYIQAKTEYFEQFSDTELDIELEDKQ